MPYMPCMEQLVVLEAITVSVCSEGIHPRPGTLRSGSGFLLCVEKIILAGGSYGLNNVRWQQQQINLFSHGNFRSIDTDRYNTR